ncbi:unnamed protein product [Paramecium sonneborni]|uniref:Uncharacterized protein n=1 Tax=Paramecium sonneborni TaxID=65129 RepID=A0A8S1QB97_9CILI|nr:unnamed protein product [Paramecium sonneborni]
MQFYANFSFIFSKDDMWNFNQFITEQSEDTKILLDEDFYNEILNKDSEQSDKPQIVEIDKSLLEQELQIVKLNKQKRNYQEEYLKLINFETYTKELSLGQLTRLLIDNQYVDQQELKIYKKYSNEYLIESGRIFGVPLVFYNKQELQNKQVLQNKQELEHNHSLYLVDYCMDCNWFQLYRKVRLSQEVNKQLILIMFSKEGEIVNVKKIQNYK